jgi:hypothetical protein
MTFQGDPTRNGNSVLKALVVAAIAIVAYWSSTGGFEAIDVPGTVPTVTTTLVGSSTTSAPATTTTMAPTTTTAALLTTTSTPSG